MLSSNFDNFFSKNKQPKATTIKSWKMLMSSPIATLLKKHNVVLQRISNEAKKFFASLLTLISFQYILLRDSGTWKV